MHLIIVEMYSYMSSGRVLLYWLKGLDNSPLQNWDWSILWSSLTERQKHWKHFLLFALHRYHHFLNRSSLAYVTGIKSEQSTSSKTATVIKDRPLQMEVIRPIDCGGSYIKPIHYFSPGLVKVDLLQNLHLVDGVTQCAQTRTLVRYSVAAWGKTGPHVKCLHMKTPASVCANG